MDLFIQNLPAVIGVGFFYALVFFVGVWGHKFYSQKSAFQADGSENTACGEAFLGHRKIPLWIGIFTMTATWVGGGYLNGTAEASFRDGLLWTQAPWGYSLSLLIGGLFFAYPMRKKNYTTMLDPFHEKYGAKVAAILFIPALIGELFWSSAILVALGTSFSTLFNLSSSMAILISWSLTIIYTYSGGIWSVALTDVLQLILTLFGTFLALPYVLDHAGGITSLWEKYQVLMGSKASLFPDTEALGPQAWVWWDYALLLCFGGIPWGVYFQRVLSSPTPEKARSLSIWASLFCFLLAIPPALIGMSGAILDWKQTGINSPDATLILPLVMKYFTPQSVYIVGMGAIAGAVMASVDSSILSVATMFSWNIYRPLNPKASDKEILKVGRMSVLAFGVLALILAFKVKSVYILWALCSDFVYVLLFPQLIIVLFDSKASKQGAILGLWIGFLLRLGGGEPTLGISPILPYPMLDPKWGTLFPFKTFAMGASLLSIWVVNRLSAVNEKQESLSENAYSTSLS